MVEGGEEDGRKVQRLADLEGGRRMTRKCDKMAGC